MVGSWPSSKWHRRFLVWCLAPAISAAVATRSELSLDALRAWIPAALRPEPTTLPEASNAARRLLPLLEGPREQSPAAKAGILALSVWDKSVAAAPDELTQAREWLAVNRSALAACRAAASEPGCRFPSAAVTNSAIGLDPLLKLGWGLLADARGRWRGGDRIEAMRELKDALALSGHITGGANTLIQYLIGASLRRRSLDAIRAAALSPEVTTSDLTVLDGYLDKGVDEVAQFRACIRRELWDVVVPSLQLGVLLPILRTWGTNDLVWILHPEELRRPMVLILDPKLLASHPRPYDVERSGRQVMLHWTEVDRRASTSWNPIPPSDNTEEVREKFLTDLAPVLDKLEDEDLPLSDEAVALASPLFARIEDPVGRLMESFPELMPMVYSRVFDLATRWDASRTTVAIRRWASDHGGALPDSLKSLVAAGLLPGLPRDRFAGTPLSYSASRQLLWSVGTNGRDDRGERVSAGSAGASENAPDDLLWTVKVGTTP